MERSKRTKDQNDVTNVQKHTDLGGKYTAKSWQKEKKKKRDVSSAGEKKAGKKKREGQMGGDGGGGCRKPDTRQSLLRGTRWTHGGHVEGVKVNNKKKKKESRPNLRKKGLGPTEWAVGKRGGAMTKEADGN